MTDEIQDLSRVARQLVQIEELFGGTYMPVERCPLPAIEIPDPSAVEPDPADKAPALEALGREVAACTACVLSRGRTNTVPGEGNPDADLVFIGEGPGRDEDASGRPFVGRAGQLLTKMIGAMGLTREDVFIANVVKCRPPNNRTPQPDEVAACWDYLLRQLQIIRPKVIVTLGNPSTKKLLDTATGITRMRGTWQALPEWAPGLGGIPVMPTFHPSYVLRRYDAETRGKVWHDLQLVMAHLGLKVPEPKA